MESILPVERDDVVMSPQSYDPFILGTDDGDWHFLSDSLLFFFINLVSLTIVFEIHGFVSCDVILKGDVMISNP